MGVSYVVWGITAAVVGAEELTPVFWAGCPWSTLSRAAWDLQVRYGWPVTVLLLGGLVTLTVHLIRGKNLSEGDRTK